MQLALIGKVCLCAQVDIAQLHKASDGWLSQSGGSQVEIGAHKDDIKATTWIVDEAETEESAADVTVLKDCMSGGTVSCSILKDKSKWLDVASNHKA